MHSNNIWNVILRDKKQKRTSLNLHHLSHFCCFFSVSLWRELNGQSILLLLVLMSLSVLVIEAMYCSKKRTIFITVKTQVYTWSYAKSLICSASHLLSQWYPVGSFRSALCCLILLLPLYLFHPHVTQSYQAKYVQPYHFHSPSVYQQVSICRVVTSIWSAGGSEFGSVTWYMSACVCLTWGKSWTNAPCWSFCLLKLQRKKHIITNILQY